MTEHTSTPDETTEDETTEDETQTRPEVTPEPDVEQTEQTVTGDGSGEAASPLDDALYGVQDDDAEQDGSGGEDEAEGTR